MRFLSQNVRENFRSIATNISLLSEKPRLNGVAFLDPLNSLMLIPPRLLLQVMEMTIQFPFKLFFCPFRFHSLFPVLFSLPHAL